MSCPNSLHVGDVGKFNLGSGATADLQFTSRTCEKSFLSSRVGRYDVGLLLTVLTERKISLLQDMAFHRMW